MSVTPSGLVEGDESSNFIPVSRHPFRPAAIGVLSAALPGIGHLFIGRRRKAVVLLLLLGMLLAAFWPFRVLQYYAGFLALFMSWIVLGLYASCSAFLSADEPQSKPPSRNWLLVLVPVAFTVLSLTGAAATRLTGFRSFQIPSTGMEPTIRQGDHIVADMRYYRSHTPKRLDTIVFERDNIFFIKRVIAIGGDSVEGKNQVIYVDGRVLEEPYVEHIGEPPDWANTFGPVIVPANKVFGMGDNRDYSLDSRSEDFGLVDRSAVVGKPLYVFASDRTGKSVR